jgi:hypothetical protein
MGESKPPNRWNSEGGIAAEIGISAVVAVAIIIALFAWHP